MKVKKIYFAILVLLSFQSFAQFTLPTLPYQYAALEPYIDQQTMEIHYTKHHQAYINNLNTEVVKDSNLKNKSLLQIVQNISKFNTAVRNNAGGHFNHSLFWEVMTPNKTEINKDLKLKIEKNFGSFEKFKEEFSKTAKTKFGSGWAWLIVDKKGNLKICSTSNQDNPLMDIAKEKGKPILALDIWEHAYYLKYQNKRVDYIDAFWNVVNWDKVYSLMISK